MTAQREKAMKSIALLLLLLLCISCADQGPSGSSGVRGSYSLQSVNGASLPYIKSTGGVKTEITGDVISLFEGSTYAEKIRFRAGTDGAMKEDSTLITGVYSEYGESISLNPNGGTYRVAIYSTNRLTFTVPGEVWVYRK